MTSPEDISRLQSSVSAAVREHWKAFLFEGILLAILLGCALLLVTTGIYFLGRNRMRTVAGAFSSAPGRG